MTGPTAATVRLIRERDQDRCLRCGAQATNTQHRIGRGMGGTRRRDVNSPAALVSMCGSGTTGCHGWATANPEQAYAQGWAIRRSSSVDPATVELITLQGDRILLDHTGGLTYA